MDYINAAILGVVEGITEFLPISSTGHLIIAEQWLGHRSDMFNIVIQAGAILAVTIIYWRRLLDLVLGWREPENRDYAAKLIVAFLITAILGLVVKKLGFELPETATPIAWALIIGGIWMIFAEWAAARKAPHKEITWLVAILVGIARSLPASFREHRARAPRSSSPCSPAPATAPLRRNSPFSSAFPQCMPPAGTNC